MIKCNKLTKQDWRLLQKQFPDTCKGNFDKTLYGNITVFKMDKNNKKDYPILVLEQTEKNKFYILFIYVPEHIRALEKGFQERTSKFLFFEMLTYINGFLCPITNPYIRIGCSVRYTNIISLKFFLKMKFTVTDNYCVYNNGIPGYNLELYIY